MLISDYLTAVHLLSNIKICILFFDLAHFIELGQKYKNIFVRFLVQMETSKFAFEIIWPLEDYWRFKDCFSGPLENYSKFHECLYSKKLCTNLLTRVLTLKTDGKASFITDLYCLFKSLAASEHLVLPTIQPSGFNMGTTLNMNLSLSWVATSESPKRLK